MSITQTEMKRLCAACTAGVLVAFSWACSRPIETVTATGVKQIPQGQQFSGFLKDYSKLKPNPDFENTSVFVTDDPAKNIHRYVAIIVEPVAVYVASNAD